MYIAIIHVQCTCADNLTQKHAEFADTQTAKRQKTCRTVFTDGQTDGKQTGEQTNIDICIKQRDKQTGGVRCRKSGEYADKHIQIR